MKSDRPWVDYDYVAFDTETTGQYPIGAELCEVAAVKWRNGEIVDKFQTLIKPRSKIPDEVIEIHGITNEMVVSAPPVENIVEKFYDFIKGSVLIAHHAAFDLGFFAYEFEKLNIDLPDNIVICSSLLSRKVIPESTNHRLQTLIPFLKLEQGTAHRAYDDAKSCLDVALVCFDRVGKESTLSEILKAQEKELTWQRFSIDDLLETDAGRIVVRATKENRLLNMMYGGGTKKGKKRPVQPMGVVRSLDGDYLVGICLLDQRKKRFTLSKIMSVKFG